MGVYCYKCGSTWRDTWVTCEGCGSSDKALGSARPTTIVVDDAQRFAGPWGMISWPAPGTAMIFGGPGAGKSSLAALLRPTAWITSEQAPKPVKPLFDRITKGHMPVIYPAKTPERVRDVLSQINKGPVVIDSLTPFGMGSIQVATMMVEWAQERNERALGIVQVTKTGDAAGYMSIPHLVDAVIEVEKDAWGMRLFNVTKCRWSPEGSSYWAFNEESGEVITPRFEAAYSVEGEANFWLQPFPMGKARWSDLLMVLDKLDMLEPGCASAAHLAFYMEKHFMEPRDVKQRKQFAERLGLRWISPEDVWDRMRDELERRDESGDYKSVLKALTRG